MKGFTTNPSLMRKAGAKNYAKYSKEILKICKKPISFEVFGDDYNSMRRLALIINSWGKNVYVKIPVINSKGIFMGKIIKELNRKNIKLNITAVYNAYQTKKIVKCLNNEKAYGEIINIASGKPISIKEVILMVNEIIAKGEPIFGGINYREGESMELYANIDKAKEMTENLNPKEIDRFVNLLSNIDKIRFR